MAKPKAKVQIVVDVKTAKAVSSIKGMVRQNNQLMRRMVSDTQKGASGFKGFGAALVGINAGLEVLGKAWGAVNRVMSIGLGLMKDAAAERTNIRQLGFAFQAAGLDVEGSTAAVERFATAQQETTRFGDTATRNIARQFSIMTAGVVGDVDEIIKATGLIQDIVETGLVRNARGATRAIAQLYGGNLEAINQLLPAQQIHFRELARVEGVSAAATAALQMLRDTYGGTAQSIDETTLGLSQLTNGWGDFKEELGGVLADFVIEEGVFDRILEGLNGMIRWVDMNGEDMLLFFRGMSGMARALAEDLGILDPSTRGGTAGALGRFLEEERQQEQAPGVIQETKVFLALEDLLDSFPTRLGEEFTQSQLQTARMLSERGIVDARLEAALIALAQSMIQPPAPEPAADDDDGSGVTPAERRARERAQQRRARERARLLEAKDASAESAAQRQQQFLGLGKFSGLAGGAGFGEDLPIDQQFQNALALAPQLSDALSGIGESVADAFAPAADEFARLSDVAAEAEQAWAGFADSVGRGAISAGMQMGHAIGGAAVGSAVDVKSIFAGMFNAVGAAASAAAAAQASVSAMFPFLGLAIGASVFAGMLGASGKSPPRRTSGAATTATEDVFTGLRPEADRGGRAIFVNQSFGAVFNTDDTRREISRLRDEAITMGEARVANG